MTPRRQRSLFFGLLATAVVCTGLCCSSAFYEWGYISSHRGIALFRGGVVLGDLYAAGVWRLPPFEGFFPLRAAEPLDWAPRVELQTSQWAFVPLVEPALLLWVVLASLYLHSCRRIRRGGGKSCLDCGYSLVGNVSGRCPECGWVIVAPPAKSSRRRRMLLAGTLCMIAAVTGIPAFYSYMRASVSSAYPTSGRGRLEFRTWSFSASHVWWIEFLWTPPAGEQAYRTLLRWKAWPWGDVDWEKFDL